jgi:hypothetical protein
MAKYRKKPVVIEAITFHELVAHGVAEYAQSGANLSDTGMPWSFKYKGHAITHERDDCYLIPTLEGTLHMTHADMLITGVQGEIYPCKRDIFEQTYERHLEPHQERVVDEKAQCDERLWKLTAFVNGTKWNTVDPMEQRRLMAQMRVMTQLSMILAERIANF